MRIVYVDAGAFIAHLWARDDAYDRVHRHWRRLREADDLLVTCEPVVAETATRLRYDAGLRCSLGFRELLDASVVSGILRIRESDHELRQRAFDVIERYGDLALSYADATGAAVATETRAAAVFGLDHHFRIMGFDLEPPP
ncbi:MAG: type II toxin-antitoxin system VapC family toxin [Egibacteraceae bacterium]